MVLTQLAMRSVMSFMAWGRSRLREAHLPQCRLETRIVVVISLVSAPMLKIPSRRGGRVLREERLCWPILGRDGG